ncbi:MAG: bifunctional hydroxymethylpyrimidine kinase/phosphomethylpyrimidine kinase, partial [Acidobacteria bacterium]|nr:bifunctional hydroxymethylpyrimidine kinase/phosphomethylpyrimidine kinase [Acidobacteriota bacterium]
PNIPEAERITGLKIFDEEGMLRAARVMRGLGARAVLVKGGHLRDMESGAVDVLDEEGRVTVFRGERIETASTHGTGCTLAAAMAACLGRGLTLEQAVGTAKRFVSDALRQAPQLGHGHGPVNHHVRPRFEA